MLHLHHRLPSRPSLKPLGFFFCLLDAFLLVFTLFLRSLGLKHSSLIASYAIFGHGVSPCVSVWTCPWKWVRAPEIPGEHSFPLSVQACGIVSLSSPLLLLIRWQRLAVRNCWPVSCGILPGFLRASSRLFVRLHGSRCSLHTRRQDRCRCKCRRFCARAVAVQLPQPLALMVQGLVISTNDAL